MEWLKDGGSSVYRRFETTTLDGKDAARIVDTDHVLTDAASIARGFAQKDTSFLATVASPRLSHLREFAGPDWATSAKALADIQRSIGASRWIDLAPR